jgi:hypothetical protein
MITGHPGNASIEMFASQFLEFLRQPVRTVFSINEEKLRSFAFLTFTPANELGQFRRSIHVEGATLQKEADHTQIFLFTIRSMVDE